MDNPQRKIFLFLMTEKGLRVLNKIINTFPTEVIEQVITCRDPAVNNDFYVEITEICRKHNIPFSDKLPTRTPTRDDLYIAISWRTLIPVNDGKRLVVFHDSLLPKYRGFNPLVSALLNGETTLGASALLADEKYDRGKIILQKSSNIDYPIKIQDAIQRIASLYEQLCIEIISNFFAGTKMKETIQNEADATYSIWRDEEDYKIDWSKSAETIQRLVDSVGYPYKGASTTLSGNVVRIFSVELMHPLKIENNSPGKIFEIENGYPVVLCGNGLLKITDLRDEDGRSLLPLKKLKLRLGSSKQDY